MWRQTSNPECLREKKHALPTARAGEYQLMPTPDVVHNVDLVSVKSKRSDCVIIDVNGNIVVASDLASSTISRLTAAGINVSDDSVLGRECVNESIHLRLRVERFINVRVK